MKLFCLGTPLKKILHVHSKRLAPVREQITSIPKTGRLEGYKLSNVLYLETAPQQHYVPPASQPWPCCGCQAHWKAALQIHPEGLSGVMWSLLAFSSTHTVSTSDTEDARAGPVTTLHGGLPGWGSTYYSACRCRLKGQELFKRHTRVVLCGSKSHATQLPTVSVERPRPQDCRSCRTNAGSLGDALSILRLFSAYPGEAPQRLCQRIHDRQPEILVFRTQMGTCDRTAWTSIQKLACATHYRYFLRAFKSTGYCKRHVWTISDGNSFPSHRAHLCSSRCSVHSGVFLSDTFFSPVQVEVTAWSDFTVKLPSKLLFTTSLPSTGPAGNLA